MKVFPNQGTGMTTLCTINDDGLDTFPSVEDSSTDSPIDEVRDACSSSFTTAVSRILPDIIVEKAADSPNQDVLEDAHHFNIKNSTMNHSAILADLNNDFEVQNLSPITKRKKKKKFKLLDVGEQPLSLFGVTDSRDLSVSSNSLATGTTPRHVRAVMKRLKAVGRKYDTDIGETADCNNNSIECMSETSEQQNPLHEAGDGDCPSEEEWSPTKMVRRPLATRNWLHPNDNSDTEGKINTYMKPDVIPSWKKCIEKHKPAMHNSSFRTSSPSPYSSSKALSTKEKRSILQISSIRECDSNVSININFESFPKHTINSDEIAAFSAISNLDIPTTPDIVICQEQISVGNEMELSNNGTEKKLADELATRASPANPMEQPNSKNTYFTPISQPVEPACVRNNKNSVPTTNSSLDGNIDKTPSINNKNSPNQQLNCSVNSDIFMHLPSPIFICKHTGKRAPSYRHIPNDEIGFSE